MLRIAMDLVNLGHQVSVYTAEWRGDVPTKITVNRLKINGWFNHQRHQSLINGMQKAIKDNPVDLVVGFNRMPGLDAYYAADPCFIARAKKERGWWYRLSNRYRFFAETERAVFDADTHCKILVLTPREKAIFQAHHLTPEGRFHIIPPHIPKANFHKYEKMDARESLRNEFGLPSDAFVLLTVGSAFLRKGLDRVIVSLGKMQGKGFSNIWILAVGQDDPALMHRIAERNGVKNKLIVAGPRDDVPMLMLGADVLVHPARSELAGLVIIEAMTAGLPLVVTENCGYAYHVALAGAGIVLPEYDTQTSLNLALPQMLNKQDLAKYSHAGKAYTQQISDTTSSHAEADILIKLASQKREKNIL